MSQPSYGDTQLDRSEMFALGAAAGAVLTAAVTEYLERRRPKTAWEKAQARGAEALDTLSDTARLSRKQAQKYVGAASEYVQDVFDTKPSKWKQTKKSVRKRTKRAQKQAIGLKDAAAAAVGAVAVGGVVDKVRDYASSASERVIGDPYAVSGSLRETLKESLGNVRNATANSQLTGRAVEAGSSALETLKSVAASATDSVVDYAATARETLRDVELGNRTKSYSGLLAETVKDYTETARETLKDAKLGDRAKDYTGVVAETVKDYTATARETLKDAKLAGRAKDYTGAVAETVKDYASTARETLKDAEIGDKVKDYATVAGAAVAAYSLEASKAARQGATKLTDSAVHVADATSEQAVQVRKGVRKSVKRTRRRARWGLRSFLIGLVIGLLAAPQSGENTREALTSFVEKILDVFMPDNQRQVGL